MRRLLGALALLLILASRAHAAVTVDSASSATPLTSGTAISWAHTLAGGVNQVLFVGVAHQATPSSTISGVTYGGGACSTQTLTFVPSSRGVDGFVQGAAEWWYLIAPVGNCTITVTFAGTVRAVAGAVAFAGADQVAPFSGVTTVNGTGAAAAVNVTTVAGDLALALVNQNTFGSNGITATAGTERFSGQVGTNTMAASGSTLLATTTTTTPTWTLNNANDRWVISGLSVKTTGTADTTPPTIPGGVTATAAGSEVINLAWSPSTDNVSVSLYSVERCSGAACGSFAEIAVPTITSLTNSGLTAGTIYRYRVRAYDGTNYSLYSAIAEATTSATRQATVHWQDNASDETTQEVYRCVTTAALCPPTVVYATVAANVTQYVDATSGTPVSCYTLDATKTGAQNSAVATAACTSAASVTPVLSVTPPTMTFNATVGGSNPASQTLAIANLTASTMVWTVGDDQAWVNEAPSSGTNTTNVTVSVSIAALTAGTYLANITVSAPGATNTPVIIPVTLNLSPAITPTTGRGGRIR